MTRPVRLSVGLSVTISSKSGEFQCNAPIGYLGEDYKYQIILFPSYKDWHNWLHIKEEALRVGPGEQVM